MANPDLEARLAQMQTRVAERRSRVIEAEEERRGRDRSQIARSVITLFVASVLMVLTGITLMAMLDHQAAWKDVAEELSTVLSSVVLPVVTLVIGYYFGSEAKDKGGR